jgi:membrane-associated phospholipid phosphatase
MSNTSAPVAVKRDGLPFLCTGLILGIGGFLLYGVQFSQGVLIVPWYVPIFSTTGALTVLWAVIRLPNILRIVALVVAVLLAVLAWLFVGYYVRLPKYEGPVAVGKPFPAFVSMTADGQRFDETNLMGPKNTVLMFFRGRW